MLQMFGFRFTAFIVHNSSAIDVIPIVNCHFSLLKFSMMYGILTASILRVAVFFAFFISIFFFFNFSRQSLHRDHKENVVILILICV